MTQVRPGGLTAVVQWLHDAYRHATSTVYGDRAALYLVRLTEDSGFALAVAVHQVTRGPDPAVLRGRALNMGVDDPLMTGSAPVECLARAIEALDVLGEGDRWLLSSTLRELHQWGEVPVLVMLDGTAVATSLSEFSSWQEGEAAVAWSLPEVGEA